MSAITFSVPGCPVAKQRPRKGHGGHFYTPQQTRDYEALVAGHALIARPRGWDRDARFAVSVAVHLADGRRRDLDNIVKSINDALSGVLWRDDSQVDGIVATRHSSTEPFVVITVEPLQ